MVYCAAKQWFYILPIYVVILFSFYQWTIGWPKYYTVMNNGELNVTAAPIRVVDSLTKSFGNRESASFMPYRVLLPNYDQITVKLVS